MKEKLFELINKCFSKPESEDFSITYSYKGTYHGYVMTFKFTENPPLEIYHVISNNGYEYTRESVYTLSKKWEYIKELVNELTYNFNHNGNRNNYLIKPIYIPEEKLTTENKVLPYYTDFGYDIESKYTSRYRRFMLGTMWEKTEIDVRHDKGTTKKSHITFGSIKENISQEEWDEILKKYEEFKIKKDLDKLNKRIESI